MRGDQFRRWDRHSGTLGSVAYPDPESGSFLTPGYEIDLGSGMYKKRSGSGINKPNHISESLETIFVLRYLNSLMRIWDPGSRMEKIRIRDPGCQKFGSGIRIPDPQH
jgi:hypothetical protein